MSQISKFKIDKKVYDEIYDTFLQVITDLNSKENAEGFFKEFFTPTEKVMFSKRLAAGILIAQGFDYREITQILKMSTSTISSFSLFYKYGSGYKSVVDKIVANKKISNLFNSLAENISRIGSIGGKGSSVWREINKITKNKKSKILR